VSLLTRDTRLRQRGMFRKRFSSIVECRHLISTDRNNDFKRGDDAPLTPESVAGPFWDVLRRVPYGNRHDRSDTFFRARCDDGRSDGAGGSLSLCEQTIAFDDAHSVRFCAVRVRFVRELASHSRAIELRLDHFGNAGQRDRRQHRCR